MGCTDRTDVGIIWASPEAPLAAIVMEHLIACGAKYVTGIGLVAAIQPDVGIGTLDISTRAIRGEGASYYYLPMNVEAVPDKDVMQALRRACKGLNIDCIEGDVYTTDAIHRETRKLIETLRSRNVIGIDMETSAIFAVVMYRKVKTSCILVVSTNPIRK